MGFAEQDERFVKGEVDVEVDLWDTKLACRLATTHSEEQASLQLVVYKSGLILVQTSLRTMTETTDPQFFFCGDMSSIFLIKFSLAAIVAECLLISSWRS